jgi:hypothetical protein
VDEMRVVHNSHPLALEAFSLFVIAPRAQVGKILYPKAHEKGAGLISLSTGPLRRLFAPQSAIQVAASLSTSYDGQKGQGDQQTD